MTPKELTRIKIAFYGELVCDPKLNAIDLRVAWRLVFKHLNGESLDAWPSAETLATDLGVSLSTIWRSIKRLTSPNGYFTITKRGGRGHSNHYRITLETVSGVTPFKEGETVSEVTPFAEETVSPVPVNSVKPRRETVSRVTRESLEESKEETLGARAARFASPDGNARGASLETKKVCSAIKGERLENALYYRRQELESGGSLRHAALSNHERTAADEWLRDHGEIAARPAYTNGQGPAL